MKKLVITLGFCLFLSWGGTPAHSIPLELFTYMTENPDASDAEIQAFIDNSEFAETAQLWTDDENIQSFNMPPELVDFLLENPQANEPEILAFMKATDSLKNTD